MSKETRLAAVDTFRAELERWKRGYRVELVALADELAAAIGDDADERDLDHVVIVCRGLTAKRGALPSVDNFAFVALCRETLEHLDSNLEAILAGHRPPPAPAEVKATEAVEAARAEVADLEAELADATERLEEAVAAADLDSITRLRRTAEVELPGRLDSARLRLLDARITQAEAPIGPAEQAKRTTGAAAAKAQARVDELADQLRAAEREAESAQQAASKADVVADRLVGAVAGLRAERDQAAAAQRTAHEARVRRFAGLPDPPRRSAPAAPAEAPRPRHVPGQVTVGGDLASHVLMQTVPREDER